MKNIRNITALLLCLISFLMANTAHAQAQYEVEVILGVLECENTGTGSDIVLSGKIGAGPSTDPALAQLVTFDRVPHSDNRLIFRGVFEYLPTYLIYTDITNNETGEVDCGRSFDSDELSILASHSDLGNFNDYEATTETADRLIFRVRISEAGLQPGEIGVGQVVCSEDTPAEITSLESASGAAPYEYRWQYSDDGVSGWTNITVPGRGGRDTYVTSESYTPEPLSQTRYFRRAVYHEDQYRYSNIVKITVVEQSTDRYQFDIFLGEYRCGGTLQNGVGIEGRVTIDGEEIGINGTVNQPNESLLTRYFDVLPTNFTLNVDGLAEGSGLDPVACTGVLVDNQNFSEGDGALRFYTVTNGNGEELSYILRLTSVGANAIAPGEIQVDQEICKWEVPNTLGELTPPGEGLGDLEYIWELSTDGGFIWTQTGGNTPELSFDEGLSVTTWYRRKVNSGCLIGTSNIVKVTVEDLASVSISGLEGPYELTDPAVTITGTPAGGTFSGAGVSGNTFTPATAGAGIHTITYTYVSANSCEGIATKEVEVLPDALCSIVVPLGSEGEYVVDKFSGQVVFQKTGDCAEDIALNCIVAKPDPPTIPKVVGASARTLSDEWDYASFYVDRYETTRPDANDFEKSTLGRWRPKSTYNYNTSEITRDKNFNTGTFELEVFNWQYESSNDDNHWILSSRTEKYSPNGGPVESYNAIDIASAVKMGYHDQLPYLTIQNGTYESSFFESFEMVYGSKLESGASYSLGATLDESVGHAGYHSLTLTSGQSITTSSLSITEDDRKMLVQVWLKGGINESLSADVLNSQNQVVAGSPMTEIARSGDWGLYQLIIDPVIQDQFQFRITCNGPNQVWLDDLRVQPEDAEMTCYVYDEGSMKVLTIFDSQHFGIYYQYDGEDKLVRKTIETERGTRTLQETFYNNPKVDNN